MTWPRQYDKIDPDRLRELIASDLNLEQIAAALGVNFPSVVRRAIQLHGLTYVNARARRLASLRVEEVRRLYWIEKQNQGEIAARFGVSKSTISHFVVSHHIGSVKGGHKPDGPWHSREWLFTQMETRTYQQIADECGCHVQSIIKAARGFGLIHANHPRRVHKDQARQVIREAVARIVAAPPPQAQLAPRRPPADWPACPEWLWDVMA